MPVAVIDIGTNSTRLLVTELSGTSPRELVRRSTVTGLGRGVDSSGQLSAEAIERVCSVVASYLELAREQRAESTVAIATSAVRDAANGDAFLAELRERFALDARMIAGETEARLTYTGATAGRARSGTTLVVDIGGGSTELIVGEADGALRFHTSLQVGVVRHSERYLIADPPAATELEALATSVRSELNAARTAYGGETPEHAIAVAGTPTSMAAVELELDPYDPDAVEGHRLGIGFLQQQLSRLASMPLAERREVTGLHPDRAPTIIAGVLILIATMRAFGLEEVEASEHDILLGAALAGTD